MAVPQSSDSEDVAGPRGLGRRHLQVLLLFLAICMAYILRIDLSVTIVSMTNKDRQDGYPVFDWDASDTGTILSSFFWGYVVLMPPGSVLAQRFGPRLCMLVAIGGSSVLSLLTPLAANVGGFQFLLAVRILQGMFSALVFPSSHNVLGRWTPPRERSRFSSLVYGGMSLGAVVALAGAGELCSSSLGWPSAFYVPGTLGCAWCILWYCLAANTPQDCKRISDEELHFIETSLGSSGTSSKSVARVPWRSILTSPPALSLLVVHCGQNFGHWMLLTEMPTFVEDVLGFDINADGLLSALPYICLWLATFVVGTFSTWFNSRGFVSLTVSRKIFNSLAHWGAGTTLLVMAFVQPSRYAAVALLTVAVSLESGIFAGFYCSHMDLSPNFGGALMGLSDGCGSVMGIVAPLVVGAILGDSPSLYSSWAHVFITTSVIYFAGNLVYLILATSETQPWNEPEAEGSESSKRPSPEMTKA